MASFRPKIIKAVRSLKLRVTAADVAAETGLPLNDVIRELNKIAADTHAVLQVSQTGTIAYKFSGDPEAVYRATGMRKLLLQAAKMVGDALYFALRCSFGLLLIGSVCTLLIIFLVTIVLSLFAADAADGEIDFNGEFDGTDMQFNFFDVVNLGMFFTWWHHDVSGDVVYYGKKIELNETGFISSCFSFLFGERDPNRDFTEEAYRNVADVIRRSNGVITAEQVAPYLVEAGTDSTIFPVLVRFDGVPEVTERGHIVYLFPAIQQTAARKKVFWTVPEFAEMKPWKFSHVPGRRLDMVFYFAFANLAGWLAVKNNLHHFNFLREYSGIVDLLLMYAIFFVAVPIVRSLINAVRNACVEVHNNRCKRALANLASAPAKARMADAQAFALALQYHSPQDVYYTTARDIDEQQLETDAQWLQQGMQRQQRALPVVRPRAQWKK